MKNKFLYHGSRGGLVGEIKPISRFRCDFGKGFYMGTNKEQVKSLISNDPTPYYYELSLDISSIDEKRMLELKGMQWAYFVLFNRGRLEEIKNSSLYQTYKNLAENKDLIIGAIADDAMNETMAKFIHNEITNKAFLESIRALDFGFQYVAKTDFACSCIQIIKEKPLFGKELDDAINFSHKRRIEGGEIAIAMQKKY